MTSLEPRPDEPRVSDADREHVLGILREGAVSGRISHDTLMRRTDVVLQARRPGDLYAVLQDLPSRRPSGGRFTEFVGRMSAFPEKVRRAWRAQRLPELRLPPPGPYPLSIGRAPGSMLRLSHYTVSRMHAQLRSTGSGWRLRDLGSSNGTWVNGTRITGSVPVLPGDQVRFGQVAFRLVPPQPQPPYAPPPGPVPPYPPGGAC